MKLDVVTTPQGRAIRAGGICCVDIKKKHWMCKILGLDEKYGFNRDFLKRAMYESKGKPSGYSLDGIKVGDIIEEGDESGKTGYREFARITKLDDSTLEYEYMRANDVTEHFKAVK